MILLLQLSGRVLKAYTQTWQIEPFSTKPYHIGPFLLQQVQRRQSDGVISMGRERENERERGREMQA